MFKKLFLFFIIINFISACGYTPLHSGKNFNSPNIEIISLSGDEEINSSLKNYFRKKNDVEEDKFKIQITSNYKKIDFSKNITGAVSLYKLNLTSIIDIEHNNKKQKVIFEENFNMENMKNKYDEINYERLIKKNFARSVVDKLTIELLKFR